MGKLTMRKGSRRSTKHTRDSGTRVATGDRKQQERKWQETKMQDWCWQLGIPYETPPPLSAASKKGRGDVRYEEWKRRQDLAIKAAKRRYYRRKQKEREQQETRVLAPKKESKKVDNTHRKVDNDDNDDNDDNEEMADVASLRDTVKKQEYTIRFLKDMLRQHNAPTMELEDGVLLDRPFTFGTEHWFQNSTETVYCGACQEHYACQASLDTDEVCNNLPIMEAIRGKHWKQTKVVRATATAATSSPMFSSPSSFASSSSRGGLGLATMEDISEKELVLEYVGEYDLDPATITRYGKRGGSKGRSHSHRIDAPNGITIDTEKYGNQASFIQHSDSPNLELEHIVVDGIMRCVFLAKHEIEADTELTVNHRSFHQPTAVVVEEDDDDDEADDDGGATVSVPIPAKAPSSKRGEEKKDHQDDGDEKEGGGGVGDRVENVEEAKTEFLASLLPL